MKKNGIPFPENFRSMIQNSENLETLLWLIKQELDAEFRGIWREVEEVVDLLVRREVEGETQIVEEARRWWTMGGGWRNLFIWSWGY
jgi:hypothetical protein